MTATEETEPLISSRSLATGQDKTQTISYNTIPLVSNALNWNILVSFFLFFIVIDRNRYTKNHPSTGLVGKWKRMLNENYTIV